jgi:hypothetical protein
LGVFQRLEMMKVKSPEQHAAVCKTIDDCDRLIKNAIEKNRYDVVDAAEYRKGLIRLEKVPALLAGNTLLPAVQSKYDKQLLESMIRFEQARGRRCTRLRPAIERKGWLAQIEQTVANSSPSDSFSDLLKYTIMEESFEVFVLAHSELFSEKANKRAKERLESVGYDWRPAVVKLLNSER